MLIFTCASYLFHECVWGYGGITPQHQTYVSTQLHAPTTLPAVKETLVHVGQCLHFVKKGTCVHQLVIELCFPDRPCRGLVTLLTWWCIILCIEFILILPMCTGRNANTTVYIHNVLFQSSVFCRLANALLHEYFRVQFQISNMHNWHYINIQ